MTHGEYAAPGRALNHKPLVNSIDLPRTDYRHCLSPFRFLQPRSAVLLVGAVLLVLDVPRNAITGLKNLFAFKIYSVKLEFQKNRYSLKNH